MKVRTLGLAAAAFVASFFLHAPAAHAEAGGFREEMLHRINAFRAAEGRGPVVLDAALDTLASEWAAKLASAGEMKHRSVSNMGSLLSAHGWTAMNENLFMSSQPTAEPSEVIAAWKASSGHRKNLLQANVTKIGLGMAHGAAGTFVVFNGAGG